MTSRLGKHETSRHKLAIPSKAPYKNILILRLPFETRAAQLPLLTPLPNMKFIVNTVVLALASGALAAPIAVPDAAANPNAGKSNHSTL